MTVHRDPEASTQLEVSNTNPSTTIRVESTATDATLLQTEQQLEFGAVYAGEFTPLASIRHEYASSASSRRRLMANAMNSTDNPVHVSSSRQLLQTSSGVASRIYIQTGQVILPGALMVQNETVLQSNTTVGGQLQVQSDAVFSGPTRVLSSLTVQNTANFMGDVAVNGATMTVNATTQFDSSTAFGAPVLFHLQPPSTDR